MDGKRDIVGTHTETMVITEDLIATAIQEEKASFVIKNFTVKPGCEKGSNFASLILAVKAVLQIGEKEAIHYLIFKLPPKEGFIKYWIEGKVDFLAKESHAYNYIIPAMVEVQVEKELEPIQPPFPMHYYSIPDGINGLVVLKNIAREGYVLPDKLKGLDESHCTLVMKELALFHALAFTLKNVNIADSEYLDTALKEALVVSPFPEFLTMSYKASLLLAKQLTKNPRVISAIEKMESMNLFNVLNSLIKPTEPFAVICHGDLWCNNTLFKYDVTGGNDAPVGVKFLDLQVTRYALPTTDLAYFFYTSTTRTMRKKNLNTFLQQYHIHFTDHLKRLNTELPVFTLEHLTDMFKQSALFGIINACIFVFTMLSGPEKTTDFSKGSEQIAEGMVGLTEQILARKEKHCIIQERLIGGLEEAVEMGLL